LSFGADLSPPASSTVKDSKAETSSPSSTMTAIGCWWEGVVSIYILCEEPWR
jgi:hypothetical protein